MGCSLLIQIAPQIRILVAIEAIDGRKGIDALAQLCREKLDADPFSGCLFIFRTRRGTAIQAFAVRRPGVLAGHQTVIEGAFPMVAHRHGTCARRCERIRRSCCSRPAIRTRKLHRRGVPCIPKRIADKKHLRSVFDSGTLTADGFGVEISRAGGYSRRCHFHSPVDRRESGRQPAQTVGEALRGLAVETGQRRFARYGLPRPVAHAAPGRRDRIAARSASKLSTRSSGVPLPHRC